MMSPRIMGRHPRRHLGGGVSLVLLVACSSSPESHATKVDAATEVDAATKEGATTDAARHDAAPEDATVSDLPSEADLDAWLKPAFDRGYIHGMVVGLIDGTGSVVRGYGTVGETGVAPTGDTLFQMGSLTETFTGLAAAAEFGDGGVQGTEAVQALLPSSVTVPSFAGAPISLADLASHSSGLPHSPTNQLVTDDFNPYSSYTVTDLYAFLNSYSLPYAPGSQYTESDVGEGLLGLALGLRSGGTFNDVIQTVVAGPLGLVDTTGVLSASQQSRFAPGYDGDFNATEPWTFTEAMAGSGELDSTVNDLLKLAAAEAGISKSPLADAMAISQEATLPIDEQGDMSGYGWIISGGDVTWDEGVLYGSMSFVGFDAKHHKAVALLLDTGAYTTLTPLGGDLPTTIGKLLLGWLQGTTPAALATYLPPDVTLTTAQLQPFVGSYGGFPDGLGALSIALQGGTLEGTADWLYPPQNTDQLTPAKPFKLYPTSPTTFAFRATNGTAVFQTGGDGEVLGVSVTTWGEPFQGSKQ